MIGVPKLVRIIDEPLRAWIRTQPCLFWHAEQPKCSGFLRHTKRYASECCHVRSRGAGGSDPENLVPLCTFHHQLQHLLGVKEFEKRHADELGGKSLKRIARDLDRRFRQEAA